MKRTTRKTFLNNKGSALLQTMVVAGMIVTLSSSLTNLNVGRGRANIQALKKASATNLAQIVSMHLADENLCTQMINVPGNVTPAAHNANDGIPVTIDVNYPLWADGSNGIKTVPTGGTIESNQVGDSNIYFKDIKFRIPMAGGVFDESVVSTYALPNGAGPGYRPIAKYQGVLIVELADNSDIPVPIAPMSLNFIVNIDTSTNQFESCSANRGVTEYCEQLGCDWETFETLADGTQVPLDPLDPDPLRWPRCVCGVADVAACDPDADGRPQYIADFVNGDPNDPVCRSFFVDCSDPNNFPTSDGFGNNPRADNCFGNPVTCPGWFISEFDAQGNVTCSPGGDTLIEFKDCMEHTVTWSSGQWVCQADLTGPFIPGNPRSIPEGAARTLVDSSYPVEGTATFDCVQGQLEIRPGATCDGPDWDWVVGPWVPATCSGGSPTPTTPAPGPGCTPGTYSWVNVGYRNFNTDGACAADNPTGGTGGWQGAGASGSADSNTTTCTAARNNYVDVRTCGGGAGAYAVKRCQQCQNDLYQNGFCSNCPFGSPSSRVHQADYDHIDDCLAAKAALGGGNHACVSCGSNVNGLNWRRYRLFRDTGVMSVCN